MQVLILTYIFGGYGSGEVGVAHEEGEEDTLGVMWS